MLLKICLRIAQTLPKRKYHKNKQAAVIIKKKKARKDLD